MSRDSWIIKYPLSANNKYKSDEDEEQSSFLSLNLLFLSRCEIEINAFLSSHGCKIDFHSNKLF